MTAPAAVGRTAFQRAFPVGCTLLEMRDSIGKVRSRPARSKRRREAGQREEYWIDFEPHVKAPRGLLYSDMGETFRDWSHAEGCRMAILGMVERGASIEEAIERRRAPDNRRFRVTTLADRWIEEFASGMEGAKSPYTVYNHRCTVNKHFGWWSGKTISEVSTPLLKQWRNELSSSGLAETTVSKILAVFLAFLKWYAEEDDRFRVPQFPRLSRRTDKKPVMALRDQVAVLMALPEADRGVFIAGCCWAKRQGEAMAILIRDVDLRGRRVHICRALRGDGDKLEVGQTKTGDHGWFRIPDMLWDWIEAHVPEEAWFQKDRPLFVNPRTGTFYTRFVVRRLWIVACRDAGVDYIPPNRSARHSTASDLAEAGVSLEDLAAFLTHSDSGTTWKHYIKPSSAMTDRAVSAWERRARGED